MTRLVSELPSVNLPAEMHVDMDLKRHLEDLVDHMHALKEQTSSMVDWAKSLNDEYLNEQQYRMNQVGEGGRSNEHWERKEEVLLCS